MKKSEMFQAVSTTAYAVVDLKGQENVKTLLNEKITSATDKLVEHFGDDLAGLARFLTDSINALHKEGVFGEGKNAANLRQNLSRRFATAVERATSEWPVKMTLTGYNPVKVAEKKIKIKKSAEDILTETAEKLGADETALSEIFAAIKAAKKRSAKRARELFRLAEQQRKEREMMESYDSIILACTRGKSAAEVAEFLGLDESMVTEAMEKIQTQSNG